MSNLFGFAFTMKGDSDAGIPLRCEGPYSTAKYAEVRRRYKTSNNEKIERSMVFRCSDEFWFDSTASTWDAILPFEVKVDLPNYKLRIKETITDDMIHQAEQVLIDNGINADAAEAVLQTLGYVLLDTELYPEADSSWYSVKRLTISELLAMEGEPVWVEVLDENSKNALDGYGVVRKSWVQTWGSNNDGSNTVNYAFEDYGKTWVAYATKPEF